MKYIPIIFPGNMVCFPREYGLTDHNGKHRLRGPGLDEKIGQGGVSAMGGKWPVNILQGF